MTERTENLIGVAFLAFLFGVPATIGGIVAYFSGQVALGLSVVVLTFLTIVGMMKPD